MAYMYHCSVAASFKGYSLEEFHSENRMSLFTASHLKSPVRMEAVAFSFKPPQKLAGVKDLLFFHMIFKEPESGRILYADRSQDPKAYLGIVLPWLNNDKDRYALFLALEFLVWIHRPRQFMKTVNDLFLEKNPGCNLGMRVSPPAYFPLVEKDLKTGVRLENAFTLHACFTWGEIDDAQVEEATFIDEILSQHRHSCVRLNRDRQQIPLEMLVADLCWKPLHNWEWLGFFPEKTSR